MIFFAGAINGKLVKLIITDTVERTLEISEINEPEQTENQSENNNNE